MATYLRPVIDQYSYYDQVLDPPVYDIAPQIEAYQIKGRLITVELKLDDTATQILSEAQIKADIAHKLAEQLLKENVINFTKQHEANMYTCTFKGYMYVTPKDDTEIIRKHVKGTL